MYPEANFTTVPGSIVSVTPVFTVKLPVITYGPPAFVHVVFADIVPLTFVGMAGLNEKVYGWELPWVSAAVRDTWYEFLVNAELGVKTNWLPFFVTVPWNCLALAVCYDDACNHCCIVDGCILIVKGKADLA